jgi:hypothetical protein
MRGDSHVRFGGRPGETDPEQCGHRAPGRPNRLDPQITIGLGLGREYSLIVGKHWP